MNSAEPHWLHTLGQIAGTLLMLELCFVLLLVCVIVGALAFASVWLHQNVIPVLDQYGGKAQQYMGLAVQGSDRVVGGIAAFRGRWEGITTGARVLFFGTRDAHRPRLTPGATDGASSVQELPGGPTSPVQSQHNGHQAGVDGHADQLH